jgi:hypothetical protein
MQGILGKNKVPSPARQRRYKSAERGKRKPNGWHKSLRYIEE